MYQTQYLNSQDVHIGTSLVRGNILIVLWFGSNLVFSPEYNVFSFEQSASAVPASNFAQYKGELVISLKYVTPQKPTTEKRKGKTNIGN